ncbi:SRPBCC family protein [Prauserella muralis]|uniref:Carbon monoxide dehydrogenase n=1 Tax=Prauserella muralis TaxID=588067 RepID=A0A2V4B0D8_9PSEU|nr:SRPBCC family protein [Prauserella muralis]PXY27592.1 carbon monoxide dehydrogenase [Prauserella muralis]TWE22682.1 carbon monoxide dehydrogenase subunit G [Prauserella muralis]
MRLDHEFTVPAPIDEVWKAVLDPERVAPCMPGATLSSVEGDTFKGTVKVKLGPVSLLYKGSGEFLEKNESERKLVIKASGKDARGAGTAAATVTVTLAADGDSTKGTVGTDLNVTGRPAQFGRGMISEVGGKILDTFAANLADMLGGAGKDTTPGQAEQPATASGAGAAAPQAEAEKPKLESVKPAGEAPQQAREAEAIDLFDYAGASVAKRLAPVVAGLAALFAVIAIVRALRRR